MAVEILLVVKISLVVAKSVLGIVGGNEVVWISLVVRIATVAAISVLGLVGGVEAFGISLVGTSVVAETVL